MVLVTPAGAEREWDISGSGRSNHLDSPIASL